MIRAGSWQRKEAFRFIASVGWYPLDSDCVLFGGRSASTRAIILLIVYRGYCAILYLFSTECLLRTGMISSNISNEEPPNTVGIPLGYRWDTDGTPMGHRWDTVAISLGYRWDTIRIPFGYRSDTIWMPFGYRLHIVWISFVHHLYTVWIPSWYRLDTVGTPLQLRACYNIIHGKPRLRDYSSS